MPHKDHSTDGFYSMLYLDHLVSQVEEIPKRKVSDYNMSKGGFISESFSLLLQSPIQGAILLFWASFLQVGSAQNGDLAPCFGIWSQSENLS